MGQFNMSAIASSAGVLGLVRALGGLISGLKNVAAQSINNYAHFESMQKGLETFFQSAEKGKSKFEELRKLSNETTFGVDELANAFTQMANVGANVDTINDKLVMIGNISGGDKNKFADLVSIYSKILSVGKAGSEQIQQLAMRGVPIYDTLKKIGVQGKATGEQITQAFQEMTKEGGQFYNAMNNINDTIEGKQGFISDYFKEMTVNLAEVSGVADIYKSVLDTLKEALGNVSDWLLKINDNPVSKALFQGTIITAIATIVTTIGSMLIPILIKIIGHLTTINLLQGPKGWAVLAVAGIGAGITALAAYSASQNSVKETIEETNSALTEQARLLSQGNYEAAYTSAINNAKANLTDLLPQLEEAKKELDDIEKVKKGDLSGIKFKVNQPTDDVNYDDPAKKVQELQKQIDEYNQTIEKNTRLLDNLKKENAINDILTQVENDMANIKDNDPLKILISQIDLLKERLNSLPKSITINGITTDVNTEEIERLTKAIVYLENKIKNMKEMAAWQKELSKILGFSDSQVATLLNKGFTGKNAGDLYGQIQQNVIDKRNYAYRIMGFKPNYETESQDAVNLYNNLKNVILEIMQSDNFQPNDKIFESLTRQLDEAKEKLATFGFSLDDVGNIIENDFVVKLKKWTDKQIEDKNLPEAFVGSIAQQSGDLQNFSNGFQHGGTEVGIIETIIGALTEACQSIENFNEVLNPVTTIIKGLTVVTSFLSNIFSSLAKVISSFSKISNSVLKLLTPVFKVIELIVNAISNFIEMIANAIEWIANLLPWIKETKEVEEKNTVDLTQVYKDLLNAMKENEEEYEKRKKELNASDYASKVTGVHDMILTPQGQFSTDPDDYIIATKNPSALNNNGGVMPIYLQPIINNTIADTASVDTKTEKDENGVMQMIVTISKQIASDYANGNNGWDNAVSARAYKQNGRSLAL